MLARLRIGPKLLLAPGLVLVLLMLSNGGAWYAMVRQNHALESIVQVRAARIKDATDLVAEAQAVHARSYRLLSGIGGSFSGARIDALVAEIDRRHLAIGAKFARLATHTAAGSAERRLLAQSEAAHASYVQAVEQVIELARADESIGANAMGKAERAFELVALRLAELSRLEQQLSEAASRRAADDFKTMSTLMLLAAALSVALSLAVTLAVRRSLLNEVRGIGQAAFDLANGNITVRQRDYGSDEIAQTSRALDASIRSLNLTLKNIVDAARSIDSTSRDIAQDNAHLSNRAEEQAVSLEQTSASMEALSATVSRTADDALAANRLAASASSIAQMGGSVVERLVGALNSIKERSRRVALVLDAIEQIAAQTSVLALNAAVEAGRAGEQGRGFALVASQVRVLAQQALAAAAEVRILVAGSVADIDGVSAAARGAGYGMAGLASSARRVEDMLGQISDANARQASGVDEVSCAIVQMDQMTQQNSALVQQAAAAAETLQHQALDLSRAVASFKLDETGPQALPPPTGGKARLRLASRRS